jgi:hypothetical protein
MKRELDHLVWAGYFLLVHLFFCYFLPLIMCSFAGFVQANFLQAAADYKKKIGFNGNYNVATWFIRSHFCLWHSAIFHLYQFNDKYIFSLYPFLFTGTLLIEPKPQEPTKHQWVCCSEINSKVARFRSTNPRFLLAGMTGMWQLHSLFFRSMVLQVTFSSMLTSFIKSLSCHFFRNFLQVKPKWVLQLFWKHLFSFFLFFSEWHRRVQD